MDLGEPFKIAKKVNYGWLLWKWDGIHGEYLPQTIDLRKDRAEYGQLESFVRLHFQDKTLEPFMDEGT